jgi:predicted flap endonuclease-1-like 5' DNA nuclease
MPALTLPQKSSFYIEHEGDGKAVLVPLAGTDITSAASDAITIAAANPGVSVSFTFNGTEVHIHPTDKGSEVVQRWKDDSDRKHKEWAASPEGKAQLARREEERRAYEAKAEQAQKLTTEIVSKSKFQFTDDMAELSGYGGKLEQGLRDSVVVGLEWLAKHPEKDITKPRDEKELGAVIDEHEPGHSGASFGAVMSHIKMATEKGWDNYVSESRQVAAERKGEVVGSQTVQKGGHDRIGGRKDHPGIAEHGSGGRD